MAFGSVRLIATALGLNETRKGDGNLVSNHNLLKKRCLVSAAPPDCSTIGEFRAEQLSRACLIK
jgi:hypothetical protein